MGEIGAWKKCTLEIEMKKTLNEIEHNRIQKQRLLLDKQEQELKVSDFDVKIEEIDNKINTLNKSIEWFKGRLEVVKE